MEIDCNYNSELRYEGHLDRFSGSIKHVKSINMHLEQNVVLSLIIYQILEISSFDRITMDDLGSKVEVTS